MVRHPRRFLLLLLKERSAPPELGFSVATGLLLATLPLVGFHTLAILYATTRLRLNRLLAVNVQHLCAPPFVPLACIWLGFFIRTGAQIGLDDLRSIGANLPVYILDWFIGSLVLAPVLALAGGLFVYSVARHLGKGGLR
jgi:uncharacterized protein (DUF2062 family)